MHLKATYHHLQRQLPIGYVLDLVALLLPLVSPGIAQAQTATEAETKKQAILDKIRQLKNPRWKTSGSCRYDWGAWWIGEGSVRTTTSVCGSPEITNKVAKT